MRTGLWNSRQRSSQPSSTSVALAPVKTCIRPLLAAGVGVGGELDRAVVVDLLEAGGEELDHQRARLLGPPERHGHGDAPQLCQRNALFSLSKKPSSWRYVSSPEWPSNSSSRRRCSAVSAARDGDVDEHAVVAAAEALQHGHPLSAQHPDLARLRPRLELELDRPVERLDRRRRAERRLHHRQVDGGEEVVALTDEARVGLDVHEDVEVAGTSAVRPAWPSPLSRIRWPSWMPGGDVDVELLSLGHAPSPAQSSHGCSTIWPVPPQCGHALLADELAEDAARDLLQPAGAAAGRAGRDRRAGLDAAAGAVRARRGDLERDRLLGAARGLRELDLDLGRDVGAAGAAAARRRRGRRRRTRRRGRRGCRSRRGSAGSRRPSARRGRSGRRAGASPCSTAPRTPRRPRGNAPPRPAPRTRRGAAAARAAGRPS